MKIKAKVVAQLLQSPGGKMQRASGPKGRARPPAFAKNVSPSVEGGQARYLLGRNQYAICNKESHWKRECPQRKVDPNDKGVQ